MPPPDDSIVATDRLQLEVKAELNFDTGACHTNVTGFV